MVSGSPLLLAHEVLSESPSCTKTCLRGGHVIDHKGSCVSPWVGGPWTLQGRLIVRLAPWWRFRRGIVVSDCYATKELVGHDL